MRTTWMAFGVALTVGMLTVGGCATTGSSAPTADNCESGERGNTSADVLNDTTVVKETSTTMVVWGMSCPLCAKNVDIELRRIKGVSLVTADLGEGFVYVTLDGSAPVTRGQLARAVNDSGFTIKSFQN